jgi:hypothetical protein
MAFHSNSLHRDPHLPRVEVNKFDGSDPTGWVTQMEHYFSLHGITDELDFFRYGVLYLDPECGKWWKWHRKTHKGMLLGHSLLLLHIIFIIPMTVNDVNLYVSFVGVSGLSS